MKECLFCKIGSGENPSYTLFEDDVIKVILDVYPDSPGHTLIIPKNHCLDLSDIPMETLNHILSKAKDIKKLLESKLNPSSVVIIQNNGEAEKIKHFHLHLIPYYKNKPNKSVEEMFEILRSE